MNLPLCARRAVWTSGTLPPCPLRSAEKRHHWRPSSPAAWICGPPTAMQHSLSTASLTYCHEARYNSAEAGCVSALHHKKQYVEKSVAQMCRPTQTTVRAQPPYRRACQVSEPLCNAVAHDDDAQVRKRVLIKEVADEALQHARHDRQPVWPHVPDRGRPGKIHHYLQSHRIRLQLVSLLFVMQNDGGLWCQLCATTCR